MAQIDSGLGWSVDESYYISDVGIIVETAGGTTTKATAGGCIAVAYKTIYNNYGLALISTEVANVGMTVTGDCAAYPAVGNAPDSAEIGGKIWYLRATDSVAGRSSLDYLSDFQYMDSYIVGSGTIAQEIQAILTAANMTYDVSIVTDNYVHEYVEGVFIENNKRMVTPSILGAPLFSSSVSYAVNDYVIKDGNLYKCTTAHTGDWNAGDFTQTNLLSIVSGT